jgi:hypothetical protein
MFSVRNSRGASQEFIAALCVLCFAGFAGWRLIEHTQTGQWPSTSAIVTRISEPRLSTRSGAQFDVDYSYSVGQMRYEGKAHYNTEKAIYDQINSSRSLDIHYNPNNPKDSTDPRAWLPFEYNVLLCSIFVIGVLLIKVKQDKKAQEENI